MTTPALELAVEYLSAWTGSGPSWYAETFERGSDADPQLSSGCESLSIARRGRVIEPAAKDGSRKLRRTLAWKRAPKVVAVPHRHMCADAAVASSFAGLKGPAFDLLVLYACEDVSRWPAVRCFMLTRWVGKAALLDHAMASLMRPAKRCRPDTGDLARMLRMRKADYLRERRRAEAMIEDLLEDAATRLLRGLGRNPGFPENGCISRNTHRLPLAA